MSGNRVRHSASSRFSLGGRRSPSRALTISSPYDAITPASQKLRKPDEPLSAAESVLRSSATDIVIGIPYNQTEPGTEPFFGKTFKETKSTSQDVRKSDKARPFSFGTRIRSAAGKATAKIKSLGTKPSAKTSKKMLEKMRDEQSAISLSSYSRKTHTQDQEAETGLGPNVLPSLSATQVPQSTPRRFRTDPLGCYPDTMTFLDKPSTPTAPRNQVSEDADAEEKEDSDDESWRFTLRDRALYSASVGNLNLTPHKSPSSARTTFESPLFATDEEKEDSEDESWRFTLHERALYSASVGNLNLTPHKSPSSARTTFESPLSTTEEDDEDDLSVRLRTPTRGPVKSDRSKDFGGPGRGLIRKPGGYNKLPEPVVSSPLRHAHSTESFGSVEREILKQAM